MSSHGASADALRATGDDLRRDGARLGLPRVLRLDQHAAASRVEDPERVNGRFEITAEIVK